MIGLQTMGGNDSRNVFPHQRPTKNHRGKLEEYEKDTAIGHREHKVKKCEEGVKTLTTPKSGGMSLHYRERKSSKIRQRPRVMEEGGDRG